MALSWPHMVIKTMAFLYLKPDRSRKSGKGERIMEAIDYGLSCANNMVNFFVNGNLCKCSSMYVLILYPKS